MGSRVQLVFPICQRTPAKYTRTQKQGDVHETTHSPDGNLQKVGVRHDGDATLGPTKAVGGKSESREQQARAGLPSLLRRSVDSAYFRVRSVVSKGREADAIPSAVSMPLQCGRIEKPDTLVPQAFSARNDHPSRSNNPAPPETTTLCPAPLNLTFPGFNALRSSGLCWGVHPQRGCLRLAR